MDQATAKPKLSIRDVWKVYGPNIERVYGQGIRRPTDKDLEKRGLFGAVRGATFDVWPGELITVMGLSGSGKSTLLRTVSRLIEPTFGEVWLDDEELTALPPKRLIELRRHRLGMVFQNYALLPNRTVLENVALPLQIRGEKRAPREQRALEMLQLVGLEDRKDHYPNQLSGGQQQRVGIARSLAVDPDVWFLDEPFSALDPLIRFELQSELIKLQTMVQKTILFVTHDFDEAIRLANRIVIMENGRVVQIGTPEEIVNNPADDYIANFTKNVRRSSVISVGSLATSSKRRNGLATIVEASAKVDEVADRVLQATGPVGVVNAKGDVIGTVSADAIIATLVDRPSAK